MNLSGALKAFKHKVGHIAREEFGPNLKRRRLFLEVELLEGRCLLSSVVFVPMNPIASGLGGDVTSTVGDVNGDGYLDVISTSSETIFQGNQMVTMHAVVWYENNGSAVPSFTPHTIAVANSPIPWVGVGDIDGNGTLDAVMEIDGKIYWYGNNGDGTVWTPHLVSGAQGDLSVWIADVTGDGHNDLILPYGNSITWWDNVKGDGTEWTPHVITDQVTLPPPAPPPLAVIPSQLPGSNFSGTGNSYSLDTFVNAGQVQDVGSRTTMSGLAWTDPNVLSNGSLVHSNSIYSPKLASDAMRTDQTGLAVSVVHGAINILSVGDINGDGKLDIISSGDGSIQWWENPGSVDGTWIRHTVHPGGLWGDVRMAFAEDITGTGRLDIISSGFGDVSWWENVKGDGSTWIRHTITSNDWTAQSITVGDINGDGKPDLFSFAPMASTVTWYENSGGANPTFTPHTISFPAGAGTVSLGDLNGDGRADAIITQEFGSAISWYMNWDGQSLMPNSTPPQPSSSTSETSSPETNLASLAFALPISGPGSLGGPVATLNASSGSQVSSNSASSFRLISAAANQDLGFHLVTVQDASSAMKTTLTPSRPLELDDSVDFWNNSFFFPAAKTGKQLI